MIDNFDGKYRFLSNFYEKEFFFKDKYYKSAEHAYQASKATNIGDHKLVQEQSSPRMARKIGQQIKCRNDWENIKYDTMLNIVRAKFKDEHLKKMLIETYPEPLKESNYWHDNTWGDCQCGRSSCKIEGKNWLGKILMTVRKEMI